jgi:hypothetical protein
MRKFLSLTRRLVTLFKVNTICLVEYEQQYLSLNPYTSPNHGKGSNATGHSTLVATLRHPT